MAHIRKLCWPKSQPPTKTTDHPKYDGAFKGICFVNWVAGIMIRTKCNMREKKELFFTELQITNQLIDRGEYVPNESPSRYQEILEMLSDSISDERAIPPPVILPCDELALLLWGYDNMTLLTFSLKFRDKYGINLPKTLLMEFVSGISSDLTVNDFINTCLEYLCEQGNCKPGRSGCAQ